MQPCQWVIERCDWVVGRSGAMPDGGSSKGDSQERALSPHETRIETKPNQTVQSRAMAHVKGKKLWGGGVS